MYVDLLSVSLKNKFETELRDGVHVSDITLCPRMAVWRRLEPYPLTMLELNFFTSGRAIHDAIQILAQRNEGRFEIEKEIKYENIVAHVDLYDAHNNVPIECKSSRTNGLEKPKSFHIEQLKCYMAMLDAPKGVILYQFLMHFEDKPFKEFEITMTKTEREAQLEKMKKQAANFQRALDQKNPMIADHVLNNEELKWKCKTCPYYKNCKRGKRR